MKLTASQLKKIIKEEVAKVVAEAEQGHDPRAIARLKNLAREAAADWMADREEGQYYSDIADVAHDLAYGVRWNAEGSDWSEGVKHYGSEAALVSALAETMTG